MGRLRIRSVLVYNLWMIPYVLILSVVVSATAAVAEPVGFDTAMKHFQSIYPCSNPRIIPPPHQGDGRLFGCIDGQALAAKYFIKEDGGTGNVKNIKIIWNDWSKDLGFGLHPDRGEAERMVAAALTLYAPKMQAMAIATFSADLPWATSVAGTEITYRYHRGLSIDERVLLITPKP